MDQQLHLGVELLAVDHTRAPEAAAAPAGARNQPFTRAAASPSTAFTPD